MKAVVFDFDGTLTRANQNVWKELWLYLGDSPGEKSLHKKLYKDCIVDNKITKQQWFDYTEKIFKERNFNYNDLVNISKKIQLIDDADSTLKYLKENGYFLFIVSGCVKEGIEITLKDNLKYFDCIKANCCKFDDKGVFKGFEMTKYDYEGKAEFIEIIKQNGVPEKNIFFVGNSNNDEWVYKTGCHTICINPENVDTKNKQKWHIVKKNVSSLSEIIPIIKNLEKNKK